MSKKLGKKLLKETLKAAARRKTTQIPSNSLVKAGRYFPNAGAGDVSPATAAAIGTAAAAAVTGVGLVASGGGGIKTKRMSPPQAPRGPSWPADVKQAPSDGLTPSTSLAPVAIGKSRLGSNPRMWARANKGNVSVTVEHTEYVRDLSGTAGFTPDSLAINPGSKSLFGWLSELAAAFESYRFEKLSFAYEPAVGSDTDGKLLITVDPDVVDELPETKQQMLQTQIQLDDSPWKPAKLVVPSRVLATMRLVREGAVPQGTDPHTYDVGQLIWATPGVPVAMCGELFVSYRVTFYNPNGPIPRSGSMRATSQTVAAPLGTAAPLQGYISGPYAPIYVSGTTFQLPILGQFRLILFFQGTVFTSSGTLAASGDNTAVVSLSTNSATGAMSEWIVVVNDPEDVFTVTSPATAATLTLSIIRVFAADDDWF